MKYSYINYSYIMNIHCCIILTYFSTPLCSNGVHEVPVNLFLICFLERAHLGVRHFLGGRRRLLSSAEEVLGHGVDEPCLLFGLDYLQSRVYEGLFCFVLHLHLHVSDHLLRSVVCPTWWGWWSSGTAYPTRATLQPVTSFLSGEYHCSDQKGHY